MAIGALVSCEREIDVIDPAALDDRNIYIRAYKYFDGKIADTNTLYQINGDFIKLSHAYITLSGAEFVSYDEQDTTRTENDLTVIDLLTTPEVKLAQLIPVGDRTQKMIRIRKNHDNTFVQDVLGDAAFVPMLRNKE